MLVRQRSVGEHEMIVRLDEQLQRRGQRRLMTTLTGADRRTLARQQAQQSIQPACSRRVLQHRTVQILRTHHHSLHRNSGQTRIVYCLASTVAQVYTVGLGQSLNQVSGSRFTDFGRVG